MSSIRDNTIEKVKSIIDNEVTELFNIWEATGIENDVLNTYADQVINHVVGLMKDMVNESIQKKKDLLKSVKALAQSARKLSKELGTHFDTDSHDDLPLLELEAKLKKQVQQLQQLKDQRLIYVQELLSKEKEICKKMGAMPIGFDNELPTEEEIKEFQAYLNIQDIEKKRLCEIFKETRSLIIKMMEELHISPSLDFERMVCHDHNNFILSVNNMSKLRDLKDRLKDQVEQAKAQAQEKREALTALWDYLDEPMEARQAFLETYSGYNITTLNALNAEVKRCKEKRSENVANYVNKIRVEIENLWQKCKYSELQKKRFTAMKCQTYTDDLLTLHEMEADNLRKHYNSNRKIFELLDEWEVQFEKLKELDQRANDPDRYHNRGGQLLMEEKERKAAEKKLPKLENQLLTLIDEYETIHKKPFLVYGYSLNEFMDRAREKYEVEKENLKLARKQAKDKSVKKTPLSTSKRTPGFTSMRITPASNRLRTPGGNNISRMTPLAKRKLPYDASPNSSSNKKRAVGTEKHRVLGGKVASRRSDRIQNGITHNGTGRMKASHHKKKRTSKSDTTLSNSSYVNFQQHLDNRDELRSSILPEQALKKANANLMKTPIKPVRRKVAAASTPANINATRTLRGTPRSPKLLSTPRLIPVQNGSPVEI